MQLLRHLGGPVMLLVAFVALTILGAVTGGAGWLALSLFCVWPFLWAVSAWTLKGIKDSYVLMPKQNKRRGEVLN